MKWFIVFFLLSSFLFAEEPSPIQAEKTTLTELGITFLPKSSPITDYITANGVTTLPFTSGYSNGVEVGRHALVARRASVGVLVHANMFMGSASSVINQIYQMNVFVTGRLYFGHSWRGGLFLEVGSGLEVSAAKFQGAPLAYQIDIGSMVGVGYNLNLDDVSVGCSLRLSPSLTSSNVLDGTRVAISMLW
jgi:hypothetical protein